MDIEYVRQFLGHSCLETTQLYTRIIPQQINHDHANIP
jgi:site-specific recombinase XerD